MLNLIDEAFQLNRNKGVLMFGIENLKKVLAAVLEVGNIGDEIGHDGASAGMARWFKLTGLFDELMALQSVEFSKIGDEVKDLDDAELAELHSFLKVKLDIKDDDLESVVEEGVAIIVDAYQIVNRSIGLVKKFKKDEA